MSKVLKFDTPQLLFKAAADRIVDIAAAAIKKTGRFTIALSGGNTPAGLYELLGTPHYNNKIDWKKMFVFWGDERCVPANSELSNSHNAKEILINKVDLPEQNIFPVQVNETPENAAKYYQETIKRLFGSNEPKFDLILLGMGENGHTASLFPHTDILHETKALVKEVYVEEDKMWRISFTAPFINNAHHILFLVSGKNKVPMLKKVLSEENDPEKYPAQLIKNAEWFVSVQ